MPATSLTPASEPSTEGCVQDGRVNRLDEVTHGVEETRKTEQPRKGSEMLMTSTCDGHQVDFIVYSQQCHKQFCMPAYQFCRYLGLI